jgi:hypothetical protein
MGKMNEDASCGLLLSAFSFSDFKKLHSEKHIRAKPFPGAGFGVGKIFSLLNIETFFPINLVCPFFATDWKSAARPSAYSMISNGYRINR